MKKAQLLINNEEFAAFTASVKETPSVELIDQEFAPDNRRLVQLSYKDAEELYYLGKLTVLKKRLMEIHDFQKQSAE